MTTAPAASLSRQSEQPPLLTRQGWMWLVLVGGLFIALFFPDYLKRMGRIALNDPDWSHALLVPAISAYYIYLNREQLLARPRQVCWWGLPLLLIGIFSYAFWIHPGRNDMFKGYSMIMALFGLVWFALGSSYVRVLWFPIVYLAFGVKVSDRIWSVIAAKLQLIAAEASTVALKFLTVIIPRFEDVSNRGSTIEITFTKMTAMGPQLVTDGLNVAEACAGLRMLMAFLALGVAVAFLFRRPWWQRLVLVLATVPVAVAVNVGRVTTLGVLFIYDKDMASGDFHTFVGMLMLIPALGLFLLLGWIMQKIFILDDEEGGHRQQANDLAAAASAQAPAPPRLSERWLPLAVFAGVVAVLAAGGTYFVMMRSDAPMLDLPLVPLRVEKTAFKLAWVLLPPAAAGVALVAAAFWVMRHLERKQHSGRVALTASLALAIVAGVLGSATVAQAVVIRLTETTLVKLPIPMRDHLYRLPMQLGTWKMLRDDPPLPSDIQDELGTTAYLSRIYRDTSLPEAEAGSIVRLHVAYYTGTADTVPHVPDRCWTAGGAQLLDKSIVPLHVDGVYYMRQPTPDGDDQIVASTTRGEVHLPTQDVPASLLTFAGVDEKAPSMNVAYFFAANGRFMASPDDVRADGFDTRDKYSYYCKIEVQWMGISDATEARKRTEEFLSLALPEIMALLPDWVHVQQGLWPVEGEGVMPASVK